LIPGAWDCHVHVFGPASAYSYAEERAYTPPDAARLGGCRERTDDLATTRYLSTAPDHQARFKRPSRRPGRNGGRRQLPGEPRHCPRLDIGLYFRISG
jgi:hypothetical protein